MARKEVSVKKYVVQLGAEERAQLEAMLGKGKHPAGRLLKARILLKADVSDAGESWSDSRIIEALDTTASMVYRVRKQLVEEGFEAVLSRKKRLLPPVSPIFDGREGSAPDRLVVQRTTGGTRALVVAFAGAEGRGVEHCRGCE